MWISGSLVCVSSPGLFSVCSFVLSNSDVLQFVSFYFPLEACLLSSGRWKGSSSGWQSRFGGTGRNRGSKTVIQVYFVRKKIIFNKSKNIWLFTLCVHTGAFWSQELELRWLWATGYSCWEPNPSHLQQQ